MDPWRVSPDHSTGELIPPCGPFTTNDRSQAPGTVCDSGPAPAWANGLTSTRLSFLVLKAELTVCLPSLPEAKAPTLSASKNQTNKTPA